MADEELKLITTAIHNSMKEKKATKRDFSGVEPMKVYKPSNSEFKEPIEYIEKIYKEGAWKYGCVKIIPPNDFKPPFSVDTESKTKLPYRSQVLQNLSQGKVS